MKQIRKVVIFAGGQGTRMLEHTQAIPKPLVPIAGEPIIIHLMRIFYRQGYREFVLALGYKSDEFKKYFRDYDFYGKSVSFYPGGFKVHDDNEKSEDWIVHLVETGENSTTGQRLHRIASHVENEPFFLTYGDGLADIDLAKLVETHETNQNIVTVTGTHKQERFGILQIEGEKVTSFAEKTDNDDALINGGFMVCSPQVISMVNEKSDDFSYEALTRIAANGDLGYYHHPGFWKAIDMKKDVDELNALFASDPEFLKKLTGVNHGK